MILSLRGFLVLLHIVVVVFGYAASDSFRVERHTLVLPEREAEPVATDLAPAEQCNLVPAPIMVSLTVLLNVEA